MKTHLRWQSKSSCQASFQHPALCSVSLQRLEEQHLAAKELRPWIHWIYRSLRSVSYILVGYHLFKKIIWDNSEYGSLSSSLGLWTRINLLMTHLLLFKLYRRQLHHSHTCNQPPEPVESRLTSRNDFEVPSKWPWKSICRQKIGPLGMSSFIDVALIIYIYTYTNNHNQFL